MQGYRCLSGKNFSGPISFDKTPMDLLYKKITGRVFCIPVGIFCLNIMEYYSANLRWHKKSAVILLHFLANPINMRLYK